MLRNQYEEQGYVCGDNLERNHVYVLPSGKNARIIKIFRNQSQAQSSSSNNGSTGNNETTEATTNTRLNLKCFWKNTYNYEISSDQQCYVTCVFPGYEDREPLLYPSQCLLEGG